LHRFKNRESRFLPHVGGRKTVAEVISHARRTVFQVAGVAVPGELFESLLMRNVGRV